MSIRNTLRLGVLGLALAAGSLSGCAGGLEREIVVSGVKYKLEKEDKAYQAYTRIYRNNGDEIKVQKGNSGKWYIQGSEKDYLLGYAGRLPIVCTVAPIIGNNTGVTASSDYLGSYYFTGGDENSLMNFALSYLKREADEKSKKFLQKQIEFMQKGIFLD